MKIISFSQQGPRAICILSANGVISSVTLRQPDSSGGTLTYEVRKSYHILNALMKICQTSFIFYALKCCVTSFSSSISRRILSLANLLLN